MSLILTKAGLAALVEAESTGTKVQATDMAVGDGGGATPEHTSSSTELVNETWRGPLQSITINEEGETEAGQQVVFEVHIPITTGGWYIRECAIYADDVLLAIGSHPTLYKPDPEDPTKMEHIIKAPVTFSNAETVSLVVDPTVVLASQSHVAEKIAEHDVDEAAHPDLMAGVGDMITAALPGAATTAQAGVVELATNTETITGTDAVRAVTPAGLTAKLATVLPGAATTNQAGVVELATTAETTTGTDTTRAVTPAGLAATLADAGKLPTLVVIQNSGSWAAPAAGTYRITAAGAGGGGAARYGTSAANGGAGGATTVTSSGLSLSASGGQASRFQQSGAAHVSGSGGDYALPGGGAPGGQGSDNSAEWAGNGNPGGLVIKTVALTAGQSLTISIGAGGSGGTGDGTYTGAAGAPGYVKIEYVG